ncbi:hypothetical protein [Caldisphaera sp.]|nr:hypothetical protein [Caldisphaera sp.]
MEKGTIIASRLTFKIEKILGSIVRNLYTPNEAPIAGTTELR